MSAIKIEIELTMEEIKRLAQQVELDKGFAEQVGVQYGGYILDALAQKVVSAIAETVQTVKAEMEGEK